MLSDITYIDGSKWQNSHLYFNEDEKQQFLKGVVILDKWNLIFHDETRQTVTDIRAAIQKTKREHLEGQHLVVIDYLQLITQTKRSEKKKAEE